MRPHNVKLVKYFFPETSVKASQDHDTEGRIDSTEQSVSVEIVEIPSMDNQHTVKVRLISDDEGSENAPYSYQIEAFGIFEAASTESEELLEAYKENFQPVAVQILFGAIREHLATVTARGPWGNFIVGVLNIKADKDKQASADS